MAERMTYRAYRFRLYPKTAQEAYFRRMFAACRVVFNHFLQVRIDAYEERKLDPEARVPSRFDMCKMLTTFKKIELDRDGRAFLNDVDSTALVYEIQHLDDAFQRFFRRMREGAADAGFPNPKRSGDRDSCTVAFKRADFIQRNKIRFAKIGWVNAKCWRDVEGVPVSCTISEDAAGRWWASISCKDVPVERMPEADGECVVHMGDAACAESDSKEAAIARRRQRRAQRKLERREGSPLGRKSNRYKKQAQVLARDRAREADKARTQARQEAAAIVRGNGTVIIDGAPSTRHERELARALEYKCEETDRVLIIGEND